LLLPGYLTDGLTRDDVMLTLCTKNECTVYYDAVLGISIFFPIHPPHLEPEIEMKLVDFFYPVWFTWFLDGWSIFWAKPEYPHLKTLDVIHKRHTHTSRANRSNTQIHSWMNLRKNAFSKKANRLTLTVFSKCAVLNALMIMCLMIKFECQVKRAPFIHTHDTRETLRNVGSVSTADEISVTYRQWRQPPHCECRQYQRQRVIHGAVAVV
jgi:hypothetical protein